MGRQYDWIDLEAEKDPRGFIRKGLTAGPSAPPSRGRRAIVIHVMTDKGLVDFAGRVITEGTYTDDGDYHRY